MGTVYLALKESDFNTIYGNSIMSKFLTSELELARHIENGWDCYILDGLKKVEAVVTTVLEVQSESCIRG